MRVRHATLAKYLPSILRGGLLTSKSQGKRPAVWLHSPGSTLWAAQHTVRRHGGRIEAVIILECTIPRSWLRKSKRGLWYTVRDVPPTRIGHIITFGELSRSPVAQAGR
jgi:hypothetical protein